MTRKEERPNWDQYFIALAEQVAKKATCPRASVGAIIVKGRRIVATGYNGSVAGEPHCTEVGCDIVDGHCQRAIHAETNAVAQAAKFGMAIDGATLYYWDSLNRPPQSCNKCYQIMKAAGIVIVIDKNGKRIRI